jgi:murein L,D-transpeptidase YafK
MSARPDRRPAPAWLRCFLMGCMALSCSTVVAKRATPEPTKVPSKAALLSAPARGGSPETRLIEVYRLIRSGDARLALARAEALTRDVPNFQLAQLVYGDLLLARHGTLNGLGDAPAALATSAPDQLAQLRREATVRLHALTERPPEHALPREFIAIPQSTRHAIAVDASRSRLYLFENSPTGLRLVADHYVSVGRLGVGKKEQGDQRTPLGVYFITSRLEAAQLQDFYGVGALTLNYPNEYDRRLGKTGHGIWLHGVPPQNFARSPQSTDGCVVLANEDMARLLQRVSPRSTPVVVSSRIDWVTPAQAEPAQRAAQALVEQWRQARSSGDTHRLTGFYSARFSSGTQDLAQWSRQLSKELSAAKGQESDVKELSILAWRDTSELMVVTFGLVTKGQRSGAVRRQYWGKESGQWKIFFEGVIG